MVALSLRETVAERVMLGGLVGETDSDAVNVAVRVGEGVTLGIKTPAAWQQALAT